MNRVIYLIGMWLAAVGLGYGASRPRKSHLETRHKDPA